MGREERILARALAGAPKTTTALGRILLRRAAVDEGDLAAALAIEARTGARLGDILAARGYASAAEVGAARAEQWGLGFVDLEADPPDPVLTDRLDDPEPWMAARLLPWRRMGGLTAYVTDRPEGAAAALGDVARQAFAAVVVATPRQLDQAFAAAFADQLVRRATTGLPEEHSVRTLGFARGCFGTLGLAATAALVLGGPAVLTAAFLVVLVVHLATLVLRTAALVQGARAPATRAETAGQGLALRLADHRPLPTVSLLVPLYREAGMVEGLVAALEALDYPAERLDAKLLVEEDDALTRDAVEAAALPPWISVLVVPRGRPRTKPRALNFALPFCRGDIIGIYDAEDQPAPQQLRQVARHLAAAPPETMAVQCQLSFYNARQNWLARSFELEYAIWFEVLLRGYRRLGLPLPLGGTSVFFRAGALRRLGGWDAHNVTEDADLGIRLARAGGHCAVVTAATGEEAACRFLPWIRQRSRWTKGYILTWLCHMRDPARLWRELGPLAFLGFNVAFLGSALTFLAMPLFWLSLGALALGGDGLWTRAVPDALVAPVAVSMLLGWAVMLAAAAVAMARRRSLALLAWAPGLPLYWWLGALGAWKAMAELMLAPFYWDKTEHGISAAARRATPPETRR
ncbi:MAG TPA: glycosyltransferase [Thermohalobaculum sp.]|nr:glycosyltransferase [Thermohalobaculum sp.]